MSKYIICCPNCRREDVEMDIYQEFECSCGECFGIDNAIIKEEIQEEIETL